MTISRDGIEVKDCGNYFRVVFGGCEVVTYSKSINGFATAAEVLNWLLS